MRPLTEQAVTEFEAAADELYDAGGPRPAGTCSVQSRTEGVRDVGLVTVSIGVALSTPAHVRAIRAS